MKPIVIFTTALLALGAIEAAAQPKFGNPSPTAGSSTSQQANDAADQAAYKPVEYEIGRAHV